MSSEWACIDGNEAAAMVSYALSDVIAIYPITPSSPMADMADEWRAAGRSSLWGSVPEVVEMQSEAGAAGALHGAASKGALATTYTPSQGLLLMVPNMFKLAGELAPVVIHVASRSLANHVLSIFGDHSDVLAARTDRRYGLVEYAGAPDAERVLVLMGAGAGAAEEAVDALVATGERVGLVKLRLFRPFPVEAFIRALPATVRSVAVLDRAKEPGAVGEPLFEDVLSVVAEGVATGTAPFVTMPVVVGGRYGLLSKEFTPSMVKAVLDQLCRPEPKRRFTVGITDDVTHTSLDHDPSFVTAFDGKQAVFYGLDSDGTVSTNKASVKIIGEHTDFFAQGYFVYDSKKAGTVTVSHRRFGPSPIRSTYLVQQADFVGCHQFSFSGRTDVLRLARLGATFLLNSPSGPEEVWGHLPGQVRQDIIDRGLELWVVDADGLAELLALQVSPDDCPGCGVCVEACPAHRKDDPTYRSITMRPIGEHRQRQQANWEIFSAIPELDRTLVSRLRSRPLSCCSRYSSSPARAPGAGRRPT